MFHFNFIFPSINHNPNLLEVCNLVDANSEIKKESGETSRNRGVDKFEGVMDLIRRHVLMKLGAVNVC